MMRHQRTVMTALGVAFALLFAIEAQASSPAKQLQVALQDMHRWVGDGDNGQRWQRYLHSAALEAELDKGSHADPAVVAEILEIYRRDTPGLERRRFVRVRQALAEWLAALSAPSWEELSAQAQAAREQFQPIAADLVQQRQAAVRQEVRRLEQYLDTHPEYAVGWKKYLEWPALRELVEAPQPDPRTISRVGELFQGNYRGLERPEYTRVRDGLRGLLTAVMIQREENLQQSYQQRLDELAPLLANYSEAPTREDAVAIGRTLGWLEDLGQVPALVESVRRHLWKPNLEARVSRDLLAAGIEDDVDQIDEVRENILGTSIRGKARLVGELHVELVPNPDQGTFDILLEGQATSDNTGYNGPVTVHSNGVTDIWARKRVHLSATGLSDEPAVAECHTTSDIDWISARSKIMRQIAWHRADQTQGQAERIASSRAEKRVARRVDEQADELLEDANGNFLEKFRKPLLRRGSFPQQLGFQTTDQHLLVTVLQASPYQVAASSQPPALSGEHDLAVQLHQSLVGNFSEALLGGQKLTDEKLVELLEDGGAEIPEELQISPDKDPWSITFTNDRPIRAAFADQGVQFAIRGRQFTRGEQEINSLIEISAAYQLEKSQNGSKLIRQGEVSVEYVNRDSLSVGQIAMKTFLRKKFDALFKPEIVSEGLQLPGRWSEIGRLHLQQLETQEGWMVLGWRRPNAVAHTARTVGDGG